MLGIDLSRNEMIFFAVVGVAFLVNAATAAYAGARRQRFERLLAKARQARDAGDQGAARAAAIEAEQLCEISFGYEDEPNPRLLEVEEIMTILLVAEKDARVRGLIEEYRRSCEAIRAYRYYVEDDKGKTRRRPDSERAALCDAFSANRKALRAAMASNDAPTES